MTDASDCSLDDLREPQDRLRQMLEDPDGYFAESEDRASARAEREVALDLARGDCSLDDLLDAGDPGDAHPRLVLAFLCFAVTLAVAVMVASVWVT